MMGGIMLSRMLRVRTARQMELSVEAGQVVCPRRGIIDLEHCFTCSSFRGVHDGPPEWLVCAPASASEIAAVPFGYVPR